MKIAYVMSRFPKLTETFVLYEILEQEQRGTSVEIYPLIRVRQPVMHPEVQRLNGRAHFAKTVSTCVLKANFHFMKRMPRTYFRAVAEALRGTWGSARFFFGALVFVPKAVYFARDIQQRGIDHIHAHFATHPALAALVIHRLTGIPFSFTGHGSDLHIDQRMLDRKVEAADFVVTVSRYNREFIVQAAGEQSREKIEVVHCGVDTEYFAPADRPKTGDRLEIVCVASFEEVKGHKYLVEACRLLASRGVEFRCRLIGDGPLREQVVKQIAATGIADRFELLGPRTRPEVREILWSSHVFVLPSVPTSRGQREGIPVALMEAMSCGLPVVSSDLSGIPELVERNVSGVLVPPGDAQSLCNAIERIASNSDLRERLGSAARTKIEAEFDLKRNTAVLSELIERSVMAGKPMAATTAAD